MRQSKDHEMEGPDEPVQRMAAGGRPLPNLAPGAAVVGHFPR